MANVTIVGTIALTCTALDANSSAWEAFHAWCSQHSYLHTGRYAFDVAAQKATITMPGGTADLATMRAGCVAHANAYADVLAYITDPQSPFSTVRMHCDVDQYVGGAGSD